jgi:hypothetical protein
LEAAVRFTVVLGVEARGRQARQTLDVVVEKAAGAADDLAQIVDDLVAVRAEFKTGGACFGRAHALMVRELKKPRNFSTCAGFEDVHMAGVDGDGVTRVCSMGQ